MSVQFALALLALCSLAAASKPSCEELIKPQENRTQVIGKWILHASISESKETEEKLKAINSSWIEISSVGDSDEMVLHWADRTDGSCVYGFFNYTFSTNISQVLFEFNSTTYNYTGYYLESCPGCLVWVDTMTNNQTGRSLYIFTKAGSLEDSHLETFKRQASCLNFPGEMYFPHTENLCPPGPAAKKEKENS